MTKEEEEEADKWLPSSSQASYMKYKYLDFYSLLGKIGWEVLRNSFLKVDIAREKELLETKLEEMKSVGENTISKVKIQ